MKKTEAALLVCCMGTNILYMHCNHHISPTYFLIAIILWLSASALHLVIHEIGHLFGGLISGYRLVYLSIGSIKLSCNKGKKLSLSIEKNQGGQCVMEPSIVSPCHYLCYNLGGVVANLILTFIAAGLLFVESHVSLLLLVDVVFVGIQKFVTNCVPSMALGFPNDAYVVNLLARNNYTKKDYCMYLRLYASLFRKEEINKEEYCYYRPQDVADDELLYYKEIQAMLKCIENA